MSNQFVAEVRRHAAKFRAVADPLDKLAEEMDGLGGVAAPVASVKPVGTSVPSDLDLSSASGPEAAVAVLKEAGGPLHVMRLIRRMQQRGFRPEQDEMVIRGSLLSALSRNGGSFKRVDRGVYDLAARAAGAKEEGQAPPGRP